MTMTTLTTYLEEHYLTVLEELPEKELEIAQDLWKQYQEIITTSLYQQFGLSHFMQFKDGGNVTTLHNAKNGVFAKGTTEKQFNRKYDAQTRKEIYEKDFAKNRKKAFQENKEIRDGYTGKVLNKDGRTQRDHIVSAAEIHNNPEARLYMTDKERGQMAVDEKNLTWTDGSLNQSKGKHDLKEWMESRSSKHPELKNKDRFEIDEKMASEKYDGATGLVKTTVKDAKKAYYKKKLTSTSLKQGKQMAMRQAIGIFLADLQIAFSEELGAYIRDFRQYETVKEKINAFKKHIQAVQARVLNMQSIKKVFVGASEGFAGGVISNLLTVFINTFLTTSKRIVRIITEGTTALIQAIRLFVFRPADMTKEQAIFEGSKLIVAAVITAVGAIVTESFITYLKTVPVFMPFASIIGGILGGILTGVLSVTVIYSMDNFSDILKQVKMKMLETAYFTVVSIEELKIKYDTTIQEMDSVYQDILTSIYSEYEQLRILTEKAYDTTVSTTERFHHSQNLSENIGVKEKDILRTEQDILDFFNN